jgi:transposase-like protein
MHLLVTAPPLVGSVKQRPGKTTPAHRRPRRSFDTDGHLAPFIPVANPLERFNREVSRRADVVGIFPDDQRPVRFAGT